MRKRLLPTAALLLVAAVAIAANVHFIGSPTLTINNNRTLTVCGTLAGLGNKDVTVVVSATATTTCTNKGGNVPPGQTQTVGGSVSNLHPQNGTVSFCVTTGQPGNPCPDGMKPVSAFSNVSVTVFQGGKEVLNQSF